MGSAYLKDLFRSVRGSLGRFLAIMGITALGCGFFAGLQMSGPDMRAAGDAFYDGTSLYDIRLVSTLGFSSNDVGRIKSVEGVGSVMPAVTCDVMAKLGQSQLAVRVSSLDVEVASESEQVSRYAVASSDESYLNRLMLREGRWPTKAGECVITADKDYPSGFGVGDTVEVLYGTQDVDELLSTRTFVVVGRVSASYYPYTGSFGSTSLGSGMIGQYLYVAPQSFNDAPYTEVYVQVPSALGLVSGSETYQDEVDTVKGRFEETADALAQARLADVRSDAQAELDDRKAEYEREKADAQKKLADAKAELDDAARELSDAQAELADAAAELIAAEEQILDGDRQLGESWSQLESGRKQLVDLKAQLDDAKAQLAQASRTLEAGEREWAEGTRSYDQGVS
ncbi:MAG: ABC transporter permease, partial [Atopobiaceae bacterium]|nr:ABC transporter permease [Atopobiaceae bacterium]